MLKMKKGINEEIKVLSLTLKIRAKELNKNEQLCSLPSLSKKKKSNKEKISSNVAFI